LAITFDVRFGFGILFLTAGQDAKNEFVAAGIDDPVLGNSSGKIQWGKEFGVLVYGRAADDFDHQVGSPSHLDVAFAAFAAFDILDPPGPITLDTAEHRVRLGGQIGSFVHEQGAGGEDVAKPAPAGQDSQIARHVRLRLIVSRQFLGAHIDIYLARQV